MKIAVFGAGGRVGSRVCALAAERGHTVVPLEKGICHPNLQNCDIVIDFSTADATKELCQLSHTHHLPLVTGTTGRNSEQLAMLDELQNTVKVVAKPNFCSGIRLLTEMCKLIANANWDVQIVETHRKGKRDCPSGTALYIAESLAQGNNANCKIEIHSLRCGSNFGEHTIIFATDGESLTLTHRAENADIFARGALDEAEQLCDADKRPSRQN